LSLKFLILCGRLFTNHITWDLCGVESCSYRDCEFTLHRGCTSISTFFCVLFCMRSGHSCKGLLFYNYSEFGWVGSPNQWS